jgi:hypothetical protein
MSKARKSVIVEWVGRDPPEADRFMAVGRFDSRRDEWAAGVAWSIILHAPSGGFAQVGSAEVSMLVEDSPPGLLVPGAAFDVMEGPRVVARATVAAGSCPSPSKSS